MSGVQRGFGTSGNRPRQMVRGLGIGGGRSGLGGGGGGALQNLTNNPTSRPHHVPKLDFRQNSTTVRISQQAQENPHGAEIATVQRKIKDINKMLRQTGHAYVVQKRGCPWQAFECCTHQCSLTPTPCPPPNMPGPLIRSLHIPRVEAIRMQHFVASMRCCSCGTVL
jgi:hypothetical protein